MKHPIYLSTGAFIGRKNGRNYKLAIDYADRLNSDGYEFLMYDNFYRCIDTISKEYNQANLYIPILHTEKAIGDLIGSSKADFEKSKNLFQINCEFANKLNCEKIVLHAWGYPSSDQNPDLTCERVADYISISREYNLELLVENIMCSYGDPLVLLEKMNLIYPDLHFIIDTRHAQFHSELEKTLDSPVMNNVRHIHINDYAGGYKEWEKKTPILQPGLGNINWNTFFQKLKLLNYSHSITLEAPSMIESGVDIETLNRSIKFIRDGLS